MLQTIEGAHPGDWYHYPAGVLLNAVFSDERLVQDHVENLNSLGVYCEIVTLLDPPAPLYTIKQKAEIRQVPFVSSLACEVTI
jgi:hypothetical protein